MSRVLLLASFLAAAACAAGLKPSKHPVEKYEEVPPVNASVTIPHGYALVIGVANYQNLAAKFQLQYAERDADAIYSALINPEAGNFAAADVHRLTGSKVTLANLKQELEIWLPSVAKVEARVVIYFAGQGYLQDGRAYLAPYDVDPSNVAATGYSIEALASAMAKIPAKNKVLLTDSCRSALALDADAEQYNQRVLDVGGIFSIAASSGHGRSIENASLLGGRGTFTYHAVMGLEGAADADGDGIVTAQELAAYTSKQVREATKGLQIPASNQDDSKILLAYIPAGLRAAPLPHRDVAASPVNSAADPKGLAAKAKTFREQAQYPQAIEAAKAAIKLEPHAPEPYLPLADSLRLTQKYPEAAAAYVEYLKLTDFDDSRSLRSAGFFGLCEAERGQMQFDLAIGYCQKSLAYEPAGASAHFALAQCYMHEAQANGSYEALAAAQAHFRDVVEGRGDAAQVKAAQANLRNIDTALASGR